MRQKFKGPKIGPFKHFVFYRPCSIKVFKRPSFAMALWQGTMGQGTVGQSTVSFSREIIAKKKLECQLQSVNGLNGLKLMTTQPFAFEAGTVEVCHSPKVEDKIKYNFSLLAPLFLGNCV